MWPTTWDANAHSLSIWTTNLQFKVRIYSIRWSIILFWTIGGLTIVRFFKGYCKCLLQKWLRIVFKQYLSLSLVPTAPNIYTENEQVAKYEIMDGAPVRGESIPIRLFLAGYDLTPTMRDINKKFSVRYYLNLVLVDEEERRYFKQQVRDCVSWSPRK